MKCARAIFAFLIAAQQRGERTALVTITAVIGSSSRAPGTHMAVSESGAFCGSLSGGCVEAAVVGEAQRVMATGRAEIVRLGAGSPLIDIRLPCGGGLDLLIAPDPDHGALTLAARLLQDREPVALAIGRDGAVVVRDHATGGWQGGQFIALHHPDLRLFIVGHGAETQALARLAGAHGADVVVLSPDADIVEGALHLRTPAASPHLVCDPFSAVVMLFHDHDWEPALLAQALEQPAFFIGAMGSRIAHARRLQALRALSVGEASLARIVTPVGLIPAARDPDTLALSVLAQVVSVYQQQTARQSCAEPTRQAL